MTADREPLFRTARMREVYDIDAVDDYIDRVLATLEDPARSDAVTPEDVETHEFRTVRMREGYVMDDVDGWLDAVVAEMRSRGRSSGSAPGPSVPTAGPTAPPTAPRTGPPAAAPAAAEEPPSAQILPTPPPEPASSEPAPPEPAPPVAGQPATETSTFSANPATGPSAPAPGVDTGARDPLTDSAVDLIDPALRALDPAFGRSNSRAGAAAPSATAAEQEAGSPRSVARIHTPSAGLHHVEIWVTDIEAAARSFGWLFERTGWTLFQVWENGRSWQAPDGGPYVVLEKSPDLHEGPYERRRAGLNHLAIALPERWMVDRVSGEATSYGWSLMFADKHPHAGGPHHYAAYLENAEGFEVEIVAAS
ncbi:MAG TPA: VOC family protein [Jiangellaceae bacterium]|nr:VOC family protein [Jiangellaceae bacterium]